MDQQQHMTKTEAHPYHHGRGCKVFDPNCPLCRDEPKETTCPPAGTVRLPDGRDVRISQVGMGVLLAIADWEPPKENP